MSVAKPFVFALVCEIVGPEEARRMLGVNGTGLASLALGVEASPDGSTNPMVNAGAIAATSLVPGADPDAKWEAIMTASLGSPAASSRWTPRCMGPRPRRTPATRASPACFRATTGSTATRPRRPVCTRGSVAERDREDLAVMGATLADGGEDPVTGERVIEAATCR